MPVLYDFNVRWLLVIYSVFLESICNLYLVNYSNYENVVDYTLTQFEHRREKLEHQFDLGTNEYVPTQDTIRTSSKN